MQIKLAETELEITRCFPLMVQLRPHLTQQMFAEAVARQKKSAYELAYVEDDGEVKGVAGFRIQEMLAFGLHVYVDDLVTDAEQRSRGYGGALLDWLVAYAKSHGCLEFHLDSGVHRFDAHRFYFQKRMHISSYHFRLRQESDVQQAASLLTSPNSL
jgi:GNAT superfamily N-acetyltransferase